MSSETPDSRRRSRWSLLAGVVFALATAAFVFLWQGSYGSGIERLIGRGVGALGFGILWVLGAVFLLIGALRARRKKWTTPWPLVPVLLALTSPLLVWWLGAVRATPERLVRAAEQGDVATVVRCLRRGIDPDATYRELQGFGGAGESPTALQVAALSGRTEIVQVLIQHGADLERIDGNLRPSLDRAVAAGHVGTVLAFLSAGAAPTPVTNAGKGTDPRSSIGVAIDAAHTADDYRLEDMLTLLIAHGADPTEPGLLRAALWMNNAAHVDVYLALAGEEATMLERAIVSGPVSGPVVGPVVGPGKRALELHAAGSPYEDAELLHLAARYGNAELARGLLESGLSTEAPWRVYIGTVRPLHHAVTCGQAELVQVLLDAGADPTHSRGGWGNSLHRASYAGHVEAVRVLLDHGVGIDTPVSPTDARTPLFCAAQGGSLEVVELLLERGADPGPVDGHNMNAAQWATRFGHEAVAKRLASAR